LTFEGFAAWKTDGAKVQIRKDLSEVGKFLLALLILHSGQKKRRDRKTGKKKGGVGGEDNVGKVMARVIQRVGNCILEGALYFCMLIHDLLSMGFILDINIRILSILNG
jgi:hypothetical protein